MYIPCYLNNLCLCLYLILLQWSPVCPSLRPLRARDTDSHRGCRIIGLFTISFKVCSCNVITSIPQKLKLACAISWEWSIPFWWGQKHPKNRPRTPPPVALNVSYYYFCDVLFILKTVWNLLILYCRPYMRVTTLGFWVFNPFNPFNPCRANPAHNI